MPIIKESSYKKRPWFYFNVYMETLIPYFLAKTGKMGYERERLELSDGDFIDLDWVRGKSRNLVVISHGLEGNSKDHFIEQAALHLSKEYDVLVWHYRSCSQELNRLPRFYHSGDIDDLHQVISHAITKYRYVGVTLLGFSIGGCITINYLGNEQVHPSVKGGVVFSTPMDLSAASRCFNEGFNKQLEKSFLKKWKSKIGQKQKRFPEMFPPEGMADVQKLDELLERYVMPLNGFSSKEEYYRLWSSLQFLDRVTVPLLVVNAKNDPLLSKSCYPFKTCEASAFVYLETPKYGGHTGFSKRVDGRPWYVYRILEFLQQEVLSSIHPDT